MAQVVGPAGKRRGDVARVERDGPGAPPGPAVRALRQLPVPHATEQQPVPPDAERSGVFVQQGRQRRRAGDHARLAASAVLQLAFLTVAALRLRPGPAPSSTVTTLRTREAARGRGRSGHNLAGAGRAEYVSKFAPENTHGSCHRTSEAIMSR